MLSICLISESILTKCPGLRFVVEQLVTNVVLVPSTSALVDTFAESLDSNGVTINLFRFPSDT